MKRLALICGLVTVVGTAAAAQDGRAPQGPVGTVTLSRGEYDRLLELASRRPVPPDTPPLAGALTHADIRVRVEDGLARATMRVDGEVFRPGTAKVPLIKGATLLDARSADKPLPIITEGDTHIALLNGPGTFSATLEIGAPVTVASGRGSFTLPVPPAGSATGTFDVPGEQTDIRVSSGIIVRRTSAANRTTIEMTLVPGTPTSISWATRDTTTPVAVREARTLSDVKTLVTVGDADVRLLSLLTVTVVQGEPAQFDVTLPAGYEVTAVSGSTLDRTEALDGGRRLIVTDPAQKRHQFLISLERQSGGGSFKLDTGFPSLAGAQRETGEIAIAGLGTLEVGPAAERPGLRRVDVREIDSSLASAARQLLLAAYRYQRTADASTLLSVDVKRFADAPVLAAVADVATVTTLVTTEGRALTEVRLSVRNRAQPFLRVSLPPGASMLSVDVAGQAAKPAIGADGVRVPLLRPGFRPTAGAYEVSFVYLNAGTPFAGKGDMQMTLPKMDVPINVVKWELFVPDRYRVEHFDGNVIDAALVERSTVGASRGYGVGLGEGSGGGVGGGVYLEGAGAVPGQIIGRITDTSGGVLPGVTVTADVAGQRQTTVSDMSGRYVFSGLPSGRVNVTAELQGFKTVRRTVAFDQRPRRVDVSMPIGAIAETVNVEAEAPVINTRSSEDMVILRPDNADARAKAAAGSPPPPPPPPAAQPQASNEPSLNVQNLQRRASGVLPVRIDVPKAGTSHRFVRPLVIDEETVVSFRYKKR